jgi:hypothetical protein
MQTLYSIDFLFKSVIVISRVHETLANYKTQLSQYFFAVMNGKRIRNDVVASFVHPPILTATAKKATSLLSL